MKHVNFIVAVFVAALLCAGPASAYFITSAADPALAGGTVVTFASQPNATYGTGTPLTIGGVSFTALDSHLRTDGSFIGSYPYLTQTYLDNGTYSDPGFLSMKISFATPTNAFGFTWAWAEPAATWTLTAYNNASTLLESYSLTNSGTAQVFQGIAVGGISYAILTNTSGILPENNTPYDWINIDRVVYQGAPVPLPATFLLFGPGLVSLAAMRRRFKK